MMSPSGHRMASTEGFIVWEWFSDHGRWRPYSPAVTKAIEDQFGSESSFCLGHIDDDLAAYEVDFGSMQQIRISTGKGRTIRRNVVGEESPAAKNIEWQWCDNTSWSEYDLFASQFIEDAFSAKKSEVDLANTKCHLPYKINFRSMVQINHHTGFSRQVQRVILQESYPRTNPVGAPPGTANNSRRAGSSRVANVSKQSSSPGVKSPGANKTVNVNSSENSISKSISPKLAMPQQTVSSPNVSPSRQQAPVDPDLAPTQAKPGRKLSAKRTAVRNLVATKADKQASVAWSSVKENSTTQDKPKEALSRTVSVPKELAYAPSSSSTVPPTTSSPALSHSATTSQIHTLAKKGEPSKMVRSRSTPNQITARAASKAGPRLSPVMTAMTSLLISTAIPVTLTPTLFPTLTNPPRIGTRPVEGVPPPSKRRRKTPRVKESPSGVLEKYVDVLESPPEEDCSICFGGLSDSSHYHEPSTEDDADSVDPVLSLNRCGHCFHRSCLMAMYESGPQDGSIQCPTCKTIYGVKLGNQPPGFMDYHVMEHSLPSFLGHHTIRIIYSIPPGIQGPEHPNPGMPYTTRGFPRNCYLPDNEIGKKILRLLIVAWERRLIFTVGTSATTGEMNTVIWNEIHHKTEFSSNRFGHGYPDPRYFDNVMAELAAHGVTEEDLPSPAEEDLPP